jgi:hypothetical protein
MAVRNGPGTGSLVIRYAGWMFKDNHNLFSSRDAVSFLIEVKIGPRKELNLILFSFFVDASDHLDIKAPIVLKFLSSL